MSQIPTEDLTNNTNTYTSADAGNSGSKSDGDQGDTEMMGLPESLADDDANDLSEAHGDTIDLMNHRPTFPTRNDYESIIDSDDSIIIDTISSTDDDSDRGSDSDSDSDSETDNPTVQVSSTSTNAANYQNAAGVAVDNTAPLNHGVGPPPDSEIFLRLQRGLDSMRIYEQLRELATYNKNIGCLEEASHIYGRSGDNFPLPFNLLNPEDMDLDHTEEIADLERDRDAIIQRLRQQILGFSKYLKGHGISDKLWRSYREFCKSLEPKTGDQGGWSITCNADHHGWYAGYDPGLKLFKICSRGSYWQCNYRSEPTVETVRRPSSPTGPLTEIEKRYVVHFWEAETVAPDNGIRQTWGDRFPMLYMEAAKAVRTGSTAALQMLIALPDYDGFCNRGWLFEYEFEESRRGHHTRSKQWGFRKAHDVNRPVSVEAKKARIEQMLWGRVWG
ncbi:hypothetical protein F5B20DRAFT_589071 [Whalleya microplaca]|nr:hypothetical protein F5B20DRAFT_589071 [Whalleya microplaca]